MRLRRAAPVLWLCLLAGCASSASGQPRARQVGQDVCVEASGTSGEAPAGAASGCRAITTESPAWSDAWNLHLCGPCAFEYDGAATQHERDTGHATACCYHARSPGPPLPSGGPRS